MDFTKNKILGFTVFLSLMMGLAPSHALGSEITEVFPNVFVMMGGEKKGSNSTFIITAEGVIVIDTRHSPTEAEKILTAIRKRTDLPVKFAINTSFLGDHVYGNQVFSKTGVIIAHNNVGKSLLGKSGKKQWEKYKTQGIPGLERVKVIFPNMVYEKKLSMKLGGYYMELRHFGRGYTNGDTLVFLPTFRAIIAGDMITNKETPSMKYAFIEDWIKTLFLIENLNIEIVIPGHGDVAHKPIMILMRQYLMDLKAQVQKNIKAKKNLKETQDAVRPFLKKKYPNWTRQERIDENIRRAYIEFNSKTTSSSQFNFH